MNMWSAPFGIWVGQRRRSKHSSVLTPREHEVCDLVKQGLRNKEIADTLHISEPTVKTHLQNIYNKLNVDSRVNMVQAFDALKSMH